MLLSAICLRRRCLARLFDAELAGSIGVVVALGLMAGAHAPGNLVGGITEYALACWSRASMHFSGLPGLVGECVGRSRARRWSRHLKSVALGS